MKIKEFTQTGTFSIIAMSLSLIFCVVMLFITGFEEAFPLIIFGVVILTLIICLLIFYKLTITIDDTHLTFSMGIGLIKKSFPLSEIESCKPVINSALYGIGIRITPSGWLYNVSGLSAIELSFKNRKSKIRIGTDRPEEIADAVSVMLTGVQAGSFYEKSGKPRFYLTFAILAVAIFIPVLIMVSGSRDTEVVISDTALTISGMYGSTIALTDILMTDTLQSLPQIRTRTNGFAAGKILKGHFTLNDKTKAMLFIRKDIPPYILIRTTGTTFYLNFEDPAMTRGVYKNVRERKITN